MPKRSKSNQRSWICDVKKIKQEPEGDVLQKTENSDNGEIPKPFIYLKPKIENAAEPSSNLPKSIKIEESVDGSNLCCSVSPKGGKGDIPEPLTPYWSTKDVKPKIENSDKGDIHLKPKTENAAEPSSDLPKKIKIEESVDISNLRCSVCPKRGKVTLTKEMIALIKRKYDGDSGIVYCLSKKDCKDVANAFVDSGLMAALFFADQCNELKKLTEQNWLNDKVKILCAMTGTCVFLRKNKPNVRFVLHHSLPKSMTDYWQELGRAGRDGQPSDCILYLSHFDILRHRKIIEAKGLTNLKNDLNNMVKYCDNKSMCRQVQLSRLFNNANCNENCQNNCDNCLKKESYERYDATFIALKMVQSIRSILERREGRSVTLVQCVNLFKGAMGEDLVRKGLKRLELPIKGQGIPYDRDDAERFVRYLIFERYLEETLKTKNRYKQPRGYLKLGKQAKKLERGESGKVVVVDLKKISVNSSLPVVQRRKFE